jgi:hypothetical protein
MLFRDLTLFFPEQMITQTHLEVEANRSDPFEELRLFRLGSSARCHGYFTRSAVAERNP